MTTKFLKTLFASCIFCALSGAAFAEAEPAKEAFPFNRQPLLQKDYALLPLGTIKAEGWLKEQLVRMKNGMTGHLDEVYSEVMGPRNGWLGGDGDVWERGPYWIDGLLPLAYLLDDQTLLEKVKPWIEWTLTTQKPDGYFGPDTDRGFEQGMQRDNSHDWWPKMVMLKVMKQYYSATNDKRVIDFMTRYFKYQLKELPKNPLGHWTWWGEQRGGDNLMIVYWLYNITGDKFLLELGDLIHRQTLNWTDIFLNQDHISRQYSLHCVNLAQGFKEPIVYYQRNKDVKQLQAMDRAVHDIHNTIGLPTGLWGGDELLRFGKPTAGSELCTAVEMMFSLETMLEITGSVRWADYLERVAYNALPTQISDDFWGKQYYQQVNQVAATRVWREFSSPHHDTDIIFGVNSGYTCCTSNLHQGWPKLVQNLWYSTIDNGLAALVYAPSRVEATVAGDVKVTMSEETNYPFDDKVTFRLAFADKKIKQARFPLHLRVPAWCEHPVVKINGAEVDVDACTGEVARISRTWKSGDVVTLELPQDITVSRWYDNSAVVERGPLVYALRMNEKWEKKNFEENFVPTYGDWYYQVTSDSPWNYALSDRRFSRENIAEFFKVEKAAEMPVYPWNVESAPIQIHTKARKIKNWDLVRGSVGPISYYAQWGEELAEEDDITLIPYGCTALRITEFPVRGY